MADTNMDDQMEAVFKSSRGEVDPVSGNEVPLGARPEEVRDDIPANLSEGEYIVPADVLRYYGVKFFEDLRNEAKQGWQELDQGGRVGGDPSGMEMGGDELPFDISELQVIEGDDSEEQPQMNKGGYISNYAEGGVVDREITLQEEFPEAFDGSIQMREYVGPDGAIMYVQFMNGLPLSFIPEGFKPKGTTEEAVETSVTEKASSGKRDRDPSSAMPEREEINWATADADAFNNFLDSNENKLGNAVKTGLGLMGGPLVGLALKGVDNLQYNSVMNGLNTQLEDPEIALEYREELLGIKARMEAEPEKSRAGMLKDSIIEKSGIYGGESSMTKNLKDTSGDEKVTFADTWLGDTLGFDGKAGNQGASLADSLSGARREKNTLPTPASSNNKSSINEPPTATSVTIPKVTTTPLTTTAEQDRAKKAADKLNKPLATGGR